MHGRAIYRLQAAVEKGADAVVAMRFDSNEISETASSVVAYGTAVKIRHIKVKDRDIDLSRSFFINIIHLKLFQRFDIFLHQ